MAVLNPGLREDLISGLDNSYLKIDMQDLWSRGGDFLFNGLEHHLGFVLQFEPVLEVIFINQHLLSSVGFYERWLVNSELLLTHTRHP